MYINSSLLSYTYYPFLELWYNNKPLLENDMLHTHTHMKQPWNNHLTNDNNNVRLFRLLKWSMRNNIENNKTYLLTMNFQAISMQNRAWMENMLCYLLCVPSMMY